jgi:hypothetical protein
LPGWLAPSEPQYQTKTGRKIYMPQTPSSELMLPMLKFVLLFADITLQMAEDQVAEMKQELSDLKPQCEGVSEAQPIIASLETRVARKDRGLDQMRAAIAQLNAVLEKGS